MGCGGIERASSFIVFRFDDLLFITCSVLITLLNSLSVISAHICTSSRRYEAMFLVLLDARYRCSYVTDRLSHEVTNSIILRRSAQICYAGQDVSWRESFQSA